MRIAFLPGAEKQRAAYITLWNDVSNFTTLTYTFRYP